MSYIFLEVINYYLINENVMTIFFFCLPKRSCCGNQGMAKTFEGKSVLVLPFHCQMTRTGKRAKVLMKDWITRSGISSIR